MMSSINEQEREQRVREHMKFTGVSEAEARFMVAKEPGEIPGDVLEVEDPDEDSEPEYPR